MSTIRIAQAIGDYFDDFSTIPMDINGNGFTDFITGGWWGNTLRWRENPGANGGEWPEHIIAETGCVETTRAWDVDGDGQMEIVPNTPGEPLKVFKLNTDARGKGTGQFTAYTIYDKEQGHGLGFGDITGNGRGDFILSGGWLEAPEDTYNGEWIFHPDFDLGCASVPILVVDVNRDGLNDIIVGQAHGYGLDWLEQGRDADGNRTWTRHPDRPFNSQYHDMMWVDIDNDGECELLTGTRFERIPIRIRGSRRLRHLLLQVEWRVVHQECNRAGAPTSHYRLGHLLCRCRSPRHRPAGYYSPR